MSSILNLKNNIHPTYDQISKSRIKGLYQNDIKPESIDDIQKRIIAHISSNVNVSQGTIRLSIYDIRAVIIHIQTLENEVYKLLDEKL